MGNQPAIRCILKRGLQKRGAIILAISFFLLITGSILSAAPPDTKPISETPQETAQNERVSLKTQKVDLAGQAVSRKIDTLSASAKNGRGAWINKEVFFGITWLKLIITLAFIFVVVIVERMLQWGIHSRLKEMPPPEGPIPWATLFLRAISPPLSLFVWTYGIYFSLMPVMGNFQQTEGDNFVYRFAQKTADICGTIALVWLFFRMVSLIDVRLQKWASKTESTIDDMLAPLVGKTLRIFIVAIGGMILLQNLTGIEVGPLIASLGIGGLAFALAGKDSVANFLGTMTILFDKPFQVGERIVIGGYDGVVEEVGFRSTRIRTLTGHLVTIPNQNVINTSIENIGRRPHIRWLTNFTITYDTPPHKVDQAVTIIRDILDNHEGMHPDFPPRVFFNGFNDWSLNIMVVVWYHPPDYWSYQAWQQRTCTAILQAFNDQGIKFAFPSQTVYLEGRDEPLPPIRVMKGRSE